MEDSHPSGHKDKGFFKKASKGLARLFGSDDSDAQVDEIKQMVSEGQEMGVLEDEEAKMINNIFEFGDKEVSDIMTHRRHVVGVEVNTDVETAARMMLEKPYSRYPVYEEEIDNIVGILHVKDVLRAMLNEKQHLEIRQIMRPPYFVPDTQNIDTLFRDMQQKKMHMAVVIDEYGQMAGVVAMEDILEEIVGNIMDEYDVDETFIIKKGSNKYLMKGMTPLDEVEETLNISLEEYDFDILNGLLTSLLEHVPEEGEKTSLIIKGYKFTVQSVENNMIKEVLVEKIDEEPVNDANSGLQQ